MYHELYSCPPSAALVKLTETYTITLSLSHIPISNIYFSRTVALVLLLSKSSNPPAPEELNVQKSPPADNKADNVAFIASQFNITEFQSDTVEISLRESRSSGRRKKRAVEVYTLAPNATYRTAQLDTDESGVGKTVSENDVAQHFSPSLKAISTQEKFPRTKNFPKISLFEVEKFVSANHILRNFLSVENFPELKWAFRFRLRLYDLTRILAINSHIKAQE